MRNLKRLAAASLAVVVAACSPAYANPSQEDQAFCYMTADLVHGIVVGKRLGKVTSLEGLIKDADTVFAMFEGFYTQHQKSAIYRAIMFGWNTPSTGTPAEYARYQFIGCLTTEI